MSTNIAERRRLVGGIYRCGSPCVLVLVTGINETTGLLAVTLLTPDVELGGCADLLLQRSEAGLAYAVLAQASIFGYATAEQLDAERGEIGRVADNVLASLNAFRNEEATDHPVAGPPILSSDDPRWGFKLAELERLRAALTPVGQIPA